MSKIHIFGDIHNHVDTAKKFIEKHKPARVIWLGDFWDNYGDSPLEARRTAYFVKWIIQNRPQDIIILSNHDISYRYPNNESLRCPGFTPEKSRAINEIITPAMWEKFQLFHFEDGILYSHAGICEQQMNGWAPLDKLEYLSSIALNQARMGKEPVFLTSPLSCLWKRFPGLKPFGHYNMCVGHTPFAVPYKHERNGFWAVDLDCAYRYFGIVENGDFQVYDDLEDKYIPLSEIETYPKNGLPKRKIYNKVKELESGLLIPESPSI